MSKSRSPPPIRTPPFSKVALQSTSKPKSPNEKVPSGTEKIPPVPEKLSTPAIEHHAPESSARKRRRVAQEQPSQEPMAKRIRTDSPALSHKSKNRSSPESDSQGNMADNELEVKATDTSDQEPPAPPPKKKRTRTLTTPHQSAVLHALLAQVR